PRGGLDMKRLRIRGKCPVRSPIEIAGEELKCGERRADTVGASVLWPERRIRIGRAVEIEKIIFDDKSLIDGGWKSVFLGAGIADHTEMSEREDINSDGIRFVGRRRSM